MHTCQAVRHDYVSWLPKLSDRAVVLFHDINVRSGDFGVWQLWAELRQQYPAFEFVHGHGLGVLAVGVDAPAPVVALCKLADPAAVAVIRMRFARLGERWLVDTQKRMVLEDVRRQMAAANAEVEQLRGEVVRHDSEVEQLRAKVVRREGEIEQMRTKVVLRQGEIEQMRAKVVRHDSEVEQLRGEAEQLRAEVVQRSVEAEELRAELAQRSVEAEELQAELARHSSAALQLRVDLARHSAQTAQRQAKVEEQMRRERELATVQIGEVGGRLAAQAGEIGKLSERAARVEAECNRLRRERDDVLSSTIWRATDPVRRAAAVVPPGLRRQGRRGARAVYWVLTPHRTRKRIAYFRSQRAASVRAAPDIELDKVVADKPVAGSPSADHFHLEPRPEAEPDSVAGDKLVTVLPFTGQSEPQPEPTLTSGELLRTRFSFLEPLRTFEAPHHGPRVTIVTDSINSGSLYGGVATAIILAAFLARRLDGELRVVTRTEVPVAANIGMILRTHGVPWTGNVECLHSPPGSGGRDVPMTRDDLFVTTSWWTTRATRGGVPPAQIVCILGEDERMFYPMGDEHLLCSETLSDPSLLYVVNSTLLLRHLQTEGMTPNGVAFEPAFSSDIYYVKRSLSQIGKRNFFFYARPNNPRNLYWRGITAITTALEEGVLDPEQWDFYFVGKDTPELVLPRGVRPRVVNYLPWPEYAELVRRIDVGLSLMYTPHPSYPPLDLAASGAVVVTNRFGSKVDLSCYSPNILCVEPSIDALVAGLRRAVALAEDRATCAANATQFGLPRDWVTALAPVLDHVAGPRLKG